MKSLYLHKMLQIFFVPQKSKNGKAYPKKMEFYSEYLRNYCKLWFLADIFQSTELKSKQLFVNMK